MLGITLGIVIASLISFVTARFVLPKADSLLAVGKASLITSGVGIGLLGLAAASCSVKNYNRQAISAEPLTALSQLENVRNERVLIEGHISTTQPTLSTTSYAAYVRWDNSMLRESGDVVDHEHELPDLLIELQSGETIQIDGLIYDDINWPVSNDRDYNYAHVSPGDLIVAYGEAYDGTRINQDGANEAWFVSSPFVFYGDVEAYSAEYAPALRRTATYAQIAQVVSTLLAAITLLTPLPHAVARQRAQPDSS